jgi:hypothetical protein
MPHSSHCVCPLASHAAILECPGRVMPDIIKFLESSTSGRSRYRRYDNVFRVIPIIDGDASINPDNVAASSTSSASSSHAASRSVSPSSSLPSSPMSKSRSISRSTSGTSMPLLVAHPISVGNGYMSNRRLSEAKHSLSSLSPPSSFPSRTGSTTLTYIYMHMCAACICADDCIIAFVGINHYGHGYGNGHQVSSPSTPNTPPIPLHTRRAHRSNGVVTSTPSSSSSSSSSSWSEGGRGVGRSSSSPNIVEDQIEGHPIIDDAHNNDNNSNNDDDEW